MALIITANGAWSQNADAVMPRMLDAAQIVQGMQQHDREQTKAIERYQAVRHYTVEYRGFARSIKAQMEVEVDYEAASGKSFQIISQSGSGVLCQRVLKRAIESEREASLNKATTQLTPANYGFRILGTGSVNNRPAYILGVEPLTPNKFLYKGNVWVDAADFAVAKMEVQPAKNPSFWISQTLIHHTNGMANGFWLPEQNRSETRVRIGGTAVLTIDYGTYQIVSQNASTSSTALPKSR